MNEENCCGCRICEIVCAYQHFHANNPKKAAIRVFQRFPKPALNVPIVCRQCENPECVQACPEEALHQAEDGHIVVDEEKCVGCRICSNACPFNAIYFHEEISTPIICDLCGGDPTCVKWCPTLAIQLVSK